MSEVQELVDEIKDRLAAWRLRGRSGQNLAAYDPTDTNTDVPEIEFTPLNPFQTPKPGMPRTFTELTPAWIATQCAPHIFAQGQQLVTRKQVTRAVAHSGRLTGTTRERDYEDQEILLQDGILTASCTCQRRSPAVTPATPAPINRDGSAAPAPVRTLACPHVVAVLMAYLQAPAPVPINVSEKRPSAQTSGKMVCPVTRQTLTPNRPLFQCDHCGLCYSPEGWEFLRKEARGVCCNCNARNTVKEVAGS